MGWVAAGVGAVGSIAGGIISSSAASSAASKQAAAADRASQAAQAEQAQTRADLAPYNQSGQAAQNRLNWLNGLADPTGQPTNAGSWQSYGMSGPTFTPDQKTLEATPGYQFDLSQGLKSVASSNAAKGLGVSGAALKGAATYATGLADNTLKTQQGIFQQNYANIMNPLQATANQGQNAAAQTGALGTQGTANSNALAVGGANASAAGQVGSANALAGGLNGVGSAATNYQLFNMLGQGSGNGSYYANYSGGSGISPSVDAALARAQQVA